MVAHAEELAQAGIPFIFDPGQGLPMFDGEALRRFVELATWVTVNDYEWQLLKDRTGWDVAELRERVQGLIVTRGDKGSWIHTPGDDLEIPPAKPRGVVDPTGCGDAYRAGLLYGLMRGLDWKTTGCVASLMGAIKIESPGTQNHRCSMLEFAQRYRESFGETFRESRA
jgi:adenosine kinase